ncbi:MAG: cytochrome c3 family protein, partial [bacterium]
MHRNKLLILIAAVAMAGPLMVCGVEKEEAPFHEWDGSRSLPVHRISLFAEDGQKIDPVYPRGLPFSARRTCGSCHDYKKISQGWHFNYGGTNAPKGRGGQPWILVDQATGTQLPVAGRGWANTWKPDSVGMTPWDFVMAFGRHLPGGGPGETTDDPADLDARWTVAGKLEINCLGCHSGSLLQDPSEWAKQVARQNFRWAATASSGLAEVGGMSSRLPGYWDIYQPPNPDDKDFATPPTVKYNLTQFDSKGRALVNIVQKPQDKSCLYCHSVAEVGKQKRDFDVDVHTRAGMNCSQCHRNGVDHMVSRGFETETIVRGDKSIAGLSCRGCHLGSKNGLGADVIGGRLGAPRPAHKGLPPVHLDKIACTTCHSGPWPVEGLVKVRTARANRLGIYGVARWETDMPVIMESVYMRGEDGKIAPHRMTWPAFWARVEGDDVVPLQPNVVTNIAGQLLNAQKRIGAILEVLGANETNAQAVVYVRGGKAYRNTVDRDLEVYPRTISIPQDDLIWCAVNDGVAHPFIPEIDPDASSQPERIEVSLKALAAPEFRVYGAPCLVVSNR